MIGWIEWIGAILVLISPWIGVIALCRRIEKIEDAERIRKAKGE